MSHYTMEITGNIGLSDYSNIYDYIGVVDHNDKFTISLDQVNEENINMICSFLNDKNFKIINQGQDAAGKYYIHALKSK
ncbi:hypothetical protein [Clostridium polynesiense]|uniref:hypothetical protein n=1 Tax=Clostridium polynesiense TaxID=1325933 RepID=UPI000590ED02|nr:hypothetical protein [Clostridium polynesiense]